MPKRIPEQELDAILAVVAAHPEGVRVSAIRERLPYKLQPRTLQRRFALLGGPEAADRRTGEPRAVAIACPSPQLASQWLVLIRRRSAIAEARGEVQVPLSPEAEAVKQAIRAPIQERQPVGYQRAFLDDYRPNITYYLPDGDAPTPIQI